VTEKYVVVAKNSKGEEKQYEGKYLSMEEACPLASIAHGYCKQSEPDWKIYYKKIKE